MRRVPILASVRGLRPSWPFLGALRDRISGFGGPVDSSRTPGPDCRVLDPSRGNLEGMAAAQRLDRVHCSPSTCPHPRSGSVNAVDHSSYVGGQQ
eukprot:88177-Prymnesium_polylepis.1